MKFVVNRYWTQMRLNYQAEIQAFVDWFNSVRSHFGFPLLVKFETFLYSWQGSTIVEDIYWFNIPRTFQLKYRRVICWQGKEKMCYGRKNWIFCRTSKSLTKSRNIAKLRLQMLTHVTILISHCFLSLIVVVIVSLSCLDLVDLSSEHWGWRANSNDGASDSEISLTILTILTKQLPWDTCLSTTWKNWGIFWNITK